MARDSVGRKVRRAAASGGSKSYRASTPIGWYSILLVICIVGIGLIVYSRNEKLHPVAAAKAPTTNLVPPTTADNWEVGLGVDLCGVMQPALPPSANASTVGLRTFGKDVINVEPGAVAKPADYEGKLATLGNFAKNYAGFVLTATSIQLPVGAKKLYRDGDRCGTRPATLEAEVWSSPTATRGTLVTSSPTAIKFADGQMITLAFLPAGERIPEPASKSALETALRAAPSPSSSTVTPSPTKKSTVTTKKTTATKATAATIPSTKTSSTKTSSTVPSTSATGGTTPTTKP
jgi:hypothetical protein